MKFFCKSFRVLSISGLLYAFVAISPIHAQTALNVTVSIGPQKYFVEKIGGTLVDVTVMVPPGFEPHAFEPKPQQLIKLRRSQLYFTIGISFEHTWLDRFKAANPQMKIIHTDDKIEKIPMRSREKTKKEEHNHSELQMDPHIWLSPKLVMKQSCHIYRALVRADPSNKNVYKQNYDTFLGELISLDKYLKNVFLNNKGQARFIIFHPSWGYFAQAYGLEQIPIEMEGKEPKPADLVRLIDTAKELGIKVVFTQPQFSAKNAQTIADAIGGEVVYTNPLSENWEENLKNAAQQFKSALK